MRHSKEIVVGDRKYRVTHFDGLKGINVLTQFLKILGKPLAKVIEGLETKEVDSFSNLIKKQFDIKCLSSAIEALSDVANEEEVQKLINDLLSTTNIFNEDGTVRPINFSIDFACRYKELFILLKEIASFQFADFFLGNSVENLKE